MIATRSHVCSTSAAGDSNEDRDPALRSEVRGSSSRISRMPAGIEAVGRLVEDQDVADCRAAPGRCRGAGACRASRSTTRSSRRSEQRHEPRELAGCGLGGAVAEHAGEVHEVLAARSGSDRGRASRRCSRRERIASSNSCADVESADRHRPRGRAATRPTSMRIVVVLPAPFGPRNPNTSPGKQVERHAIDDGSPADHFGQLVRAEGGGRGGGHASPES